MNKNNRKHTGFTLIELLVVLVIMTLMTLAFINSQSKFDSGTIMRGLAYQVALTIRQTQVYGTSVIQNSPGAASFGPVFGVSFGNSANSYFIFSDPVVPPKGEQDAGVVQLKSFTVQSNFSIQEVCLVSTESSNNWYCSVRRDTATTDDSTTPSSRLDVINILFKRPNPDALLAAYKKDISGVLQPVATASGVFKAAYVQLKAINGDVRVVRITLTGQVTVCGVGNIAGTGVTLTRLKTTPTLC